MNSWTIWSLCLIGLYLAGLITGYWLRGAAGEERGVHALRSDDLDALPPATATAIRRAQRKRRLELRKALRR
jgi:hypothetical protein